MTDVSKSIVVLMPTYNDWENVATLLPRIDAVALESSLSVRIVIVDDGSGTVTGRESVSSIDNFKSISEVLLVELSRNLGSQGAIAVGVGFIAKNIDAGEYDALIIMDSDHEDRPEYIPALVRAASSGSVVFANRSKRSESLTFRAFYIVYKTLFTLLTGQSLTFGNFCCMPVSMVRKVATIAEIWDSFPSGIIRARIPHTTIPSSRGTRLSGRSKMNLVGLVNVGLRAISVHADTAGARMLVAVSFISVLVAAGAAATLGLRLFTNILIVGQATWLLGIMLTIFLQTILLMTLAVFMIVASRGRQTHTPLRDYELFVHQTTTLVERPI